MKYALSREAKLEIELGIYSKPTLPTRKHPTDAGVDLYALGNYIINPHTSKIIRTGIAFEYPEGTMGLVKPKSRNEHLVGAGVLDMNFRGEVLVKIFNVSTQEQAIKHGDGIAQLIIVPILTPELELVEEILSDTDRGNSGGIVTQLKGK